LEPKGFEPKGFRNAPCTSSPQGSDVPAVPVTGARWVERAGTAGDRSEQPANARRIQRAILHSLPRDDRLRLEYIRRRWQGGQA